ncbi:MAG: nucleotide exchange factor GrpE [Pseudomonadota bacterium]
MGENKQTSEPELSEESNPNEAMDRENEAGVQSEIPLEPEAPSNSGESAELGEELGRLQDALLRTRAEMDNLHKRAEREVEKSRKFAVEGLLKDLVPVIDTLDQGIEAAGEGGAEGLVLTRKLLLDTLKRFGMEIVDPVGEGFDPQWHEAMSMLPSEEHDSNQVITVLQRGYRLHDRVVRPARVIVAQ